MRRLGNRAAVPAALLLAALVLAPHAGCRSSRRGGERLPYQKVDPAVAFAVMVDSPGVLILDLRTPEEFQGQTGHIRNARNFPVESLPRRLYELSSYREETMIVYCREDPACGAQGMAVLVASGFDDAMLIDGGIDRWIREGFKTVLSVESPGRGPDGK